MELNSCVNLPLPDDKINDIIQKAKDWALMNGLCLRTPSLNPEKVQIAPFLLLPSTFPEAEFNKAVNMQTTLNELMHRVAYDHEFLTSSLSSVITNDEFTAKLFKIYETVYRENENFNKTYSLGILRSDYMLHSDTKTIKQIEINSIASSFGGLSTFTSEWHKFILATLGRLDKLKNLPINNTVSGISSGLIDAWTLYNNPKSVIMFVVEDVTINISDQRSIEFQIQTLNPNINVIRKSMKALINIVKLGPNKELIVDDLVVSVVYYRSAYDPSFYSTENEWSVRLIIEKSTAIKCPSVQYQLAGAKKIQQMLSIPEVLKKFTKSEEEYEKVKDLYVNLYSLDYDESGDKAIEMALENPEKFVMKPQREGGGHNIYGLDISKKLEEGSIKRSNYILQDLITPAFQQNYILRSATKDCDKLKNVVSELGIYGVVIGNRDKIIVNNQAGFLLRTKIQSSTEGGVIVGYGALDSPCLIP